jgi:hypothetical protein
MIILDFLLTFFLIALSFAALLAPLGLLAVAVEKLLYIAGRALWEVKQWLLSL